MDVPNTLPLPLKDSSEAVSVHTYGTAHKLPMPQHTDIKSGKEEIMKLEGTLKIVQKKDEPKSESFLKIVEDVVRWNAFETFLSPL